MTARYFQTEWRSLSPHTREEAVNDNDDDDCQFVKRIMQNASTVLRVPSHCEKVSSVLI